MAAGKTTVKLIGRFLWRLGNAVVTHDILSLAAIIAFYAFFSLFPLILLIIYFTSVFIPHAQIETVVYDLLSPYVALPGVKTMIMEHVRQLANVGGNLGIISAVTLTWSAMSGFIAVQQAMDVIWESHQRSFIARRLVAFLTLVVLLLLTIASALVMALFPVASELAQTRPILLGWLIWVHGLSKVLFPLSLFFGLLVFYRYLPAKRAPWVYLIPGALVSTLALDAGRKMFVWYAGHLVRYQMIYGTLTVVMFLVLWMYVASILMLFGAEVSAALEFTVENRDSQPA